MIKVSVMYPTAAGSRFDWDYYLHQHRQLAHRLLDARGLLRLEIDRGVGGFPPGSPAPYHAVGHLFFPTMEAMQNALGATAARFIEDEKKYAPGGSVVLISEVVE